MDTPLIRQVRTDCKKAFAWYVKKYVVSDALWVYVHKNRRILDPLNGKRVVGIFMVYERALYIRIAAGAVHEIQATGLDVPSCRAWMLHVLFHELVHYELHTQGVDQRERGVNVLASRLLCECVDELGLPVMVNGFRRKKTA